MQHNKRSRKRKSVIEILQGLIASWSLPVVVSNVVDNGGNTYTLSVDKTYYLQAGSGVKDRTVTIASVKYKLIDIVNNKSIKIFGASIPSVGTFVLPVPYFFHGTIMQTNTELVKREPDINKKTPMVYLQRPFDSVDDAGDLDNTDTAKRSDLVLYFLTKANFPEWYTDDHDKYAVIPMTNMMEEFVELLKRNAKYIDRLTDYPNTDMIKFGVVTQDVVSKGYWSDNYSGIQMRITLGFKYICVCGPVTYKP